MGSVREKARSISAYLNSSEETIGISRKKNKIKSSGTKTDPWVRPLFEITTQIINKYFESPTGAAEQSDIKPHQESPLNRYIWERKTNSVIVEVNCKQKLINKKNFSWNPKKGKTNTNTEESETASHCSCKNNVNRRTLGEPIEKIIFVEEH